MDILITILAILLVSRGVVQVFVKDLWWTVVRFQYTMVGLHPTRTAAWERWTTLSGSILLVVGIMLYIFVPR
jgi:hypothetical protein